MEISLEKLDMMEGLVEYMGRLDGGIAETVAMFRDGDLDKGRAQVVEIIDGLGWVIEGVNAVSEDLNMRLEKMTVTLETLADAIEADNVDQVASIFQDKLAPILKDWRTQMADAVSGPVPDHGAE